MGSRLAGKGVYITGGASGIGAACAHRFAAEGANVAIAGLAADDDRADDVVRSIRSAGGTATHVVCDVTDEQHVASSFAEARSVVGNIAVVVTSAGVASAPGGDHHAALLDIDTEHWQFVLDVNVTGTLYAARVGASHMIERGIAGSVITLASFAAKRPTRGVYSVSKSAVWMLTRALAYELGPQGIRVNSIGPGIIDTPMLSDAADTSLDTWKTAQTERISLRRIGDPSDVANVALFLASDESAYLTGAILHPDGGLTNVFAGG